MKPFPLTDQTISIVDRRDHYRCVRCGIAWHWAGMSHHHRHNRSHPFPRLHGVENLIVLCGSGTAGCHAWCHSHPTEAERYGWVVSGFNDHPERVPVCHHEHGWVLLDQLGGWTPCDPPE